MLQYSACDFGCGCEPPHSATNHTLGSHAQRARRAWATSRARASCIATRRGGLDCPRPKSMLARVLAVAQIGMPEAPNRTLGGGKGDGRARATRSPARLPTTSVPPVAHHSSADSRVRRVWPAGELNEQLVVTGGLRGSLMASTEQTAVAGNDQGLPAIIPYSRIVGMHAASSHHQTEHLLYSFQWSSVPIPMLASLRRKQAAPVSPPPSPTALASSPPPRDDSWPPPPDPPSHTALSTASVRHRPYAPSPHSRAPPTASPCPSPLSRAGWAARARCRESKCAGAIRSRPCSRRRSGWSTWDRCATTSPRSTACSRRSCGSNAARASYSTTASRSAPSTRWCARRSAAGCWAGRQKAVSSP